MKRTLLALCALLTAAFAFAGTATLTWTNPTANTDGSALTLGSVNVYRGTSATGPWTLAGSVSTSGGAVATTFTDKAATDGTTEYYYVTAVGSDGNESAPSAIVSKAIPIPVAPTPNPPTGLTVKAVTAYMLSVRGGNLELVQTGTVPIGMKCAKGVEVNEMHAVELRGPNIGTAFPLVFAKCG